MKSLKWNLWNLISFEFLSKKTLIFFFIIYNKIFNLFDNIKIIYINLISFYKLIMLLNRVSITIINNILNIIHISNSIAIN